MDPPPSLNDLMSFFTRHSTTIGKSGTLLDENNPENVQENSWRSRTCAIVVDYVSKFCSRLEHDNITHTLKRLDNLAAYWTFTSSSGIRLGLRRMLTDMFVNSFITNIEKFFMVPKPHIFNAVPDHSPQGIELLACFIDFVLRIIISEEGLSKSAAGLATIRKHLTFLLTFLGDTPFQCCELKEVEDVLSEVEAVVNEAGRIVYSRVFASFRGSDSGVSDDLVGKIDLLYAKIKEYCVSFSRLPEGSGLGNARAVSMDSLYIVDSLVEDLEGSMRPEVGLFDNLKDKVREFHGELLISRSLLSDVQIQKNADLDEIDKLMVEMGDVSYEAEYLVNSYLVGNLPMWYLVSRLPNILLKIKIIRAGLEDIKDESGIDAPSLKHCDGSDVSSQFTVETCTDVVESVDVVESFVLGFEDEKMQLLDELTGGSRNRQSIVIHGMPGVGKTTLANELYNNPIVKHYFHERAWCFISQNFRSRKALIDILMCLTREIDKSEMAEMEDEVLGSEIYKSLKGKRYLVVMDDVWNSEEWDGIRRFFPDDANGSRVIFTSRIKDVVMFNTCKIHTLPLLLPAQCWELLRMKVFNNEPCPLQLLDIGKQIAANCNGLPLAVTVIGGVLAKMERRRSVWKKVKESLTSYIMSDSSDCMRILNLSYKHLPNHLKLCFLYFGAFPEGCVISVRKLMRMWIAEGFIPRQMDLCLEHIAEEYLMDLIDRSLVSIGKTRSNGGVKACMIHDLLHDLCSRKAQEQNILRLTEGHFSICEKHQRVSSYTTSLPCSGPFGLHIRSVLGCPTDLCFWSPCLKLLRVLDLSTIIYYEAKLESIGLLIQLRYLVLNGIPKSIGNLVHLEYLHVNCTLTGSLPPIVFQLLKLRYLHAGYRAVIEPCSSYQTNNLGTLSGVYIAESDDENILKFSLNLHKLKFECPPSHFPDLHFLRELESLTVMSTGYFYALSKINFPVNIKKLTLSRLYMSWEMMSMIGRLPNLEALKLLKDAFHGKTWEAREGEFMELRFLKLRDLNLYQWIASSHHFPKLQHLSVANCYNLEGIPSELGDIPTFQRIEVPNHCDQISTSALRILEEQRENGNDELQIIFTE